MALNEWIQANSILIAIGVSILLLIYIIIEIIQDIRRRLTKRRRPAVSPISYILIILGYLFLLYILFNANEIERAAWAQILLMIGLVTITAVYAWSTEKVARATEEQLLSEARPYLLLRLKVKKDELLQWDDYKSSKHPTEFPVTILNAGKGPAINLEASLWHSKKTYFSEIKGFLAPREEWQTTISRISDPLSKGGWLPELRKSIKEEYPGVVAVKYSDIHHRVWVSYLCLERHVDIEAFVMDGEQNIVELKSHD